MGGERERERRAERGARVWERWPWWWRVMRRGVFFFYIYIFGIIFERVHDYGVFGIFFFCILL